ncbi:hypothetical protein D4R49_00635, partial [bacterium]
GRPLGISNQLIVELLMESIIKEEFPDGEVSDAEKDALMKRDVSRTCVRFPLTIDAAKRTLYFPLWCEHCGGVKYSGVTIENIVELSQPVNSRN